MHVLLDSGELVCSAANGAFVRATFSSQADHESIISVQYTMCTGRATKKWEQKLKDKLEEGNWPHSRQDGPFFKKIYLPRPSRSMFHVITVSTEAPSSSANTQRYYTFW
jgi:hypothetical protein